MAFCAKCGAQLADNVSVCAKCGQPGPAASAGTTSSATGVHQMSENQMSENVAGLLCYALGWVTGIIFYLIDKRPFVRFHAAQSMVVFGGLYLLYRVFIWIFFSALTIGAFTFFSPAWILFGLIRLVAFILWIVLMIKAYQGQRFRVPIAADFADRIAK
jgi:uncharacterized membrane protein